MGPWQTRLGRTSSEEGSPEEPKLKSWRMGAPALGADWSDPTNSARRYVLGTTVYSAIRRLEMRNQSSVSRVMLDMRGGVKGDQQEYPTWERQVGQPILDGMNTWLTIEVQQLH